MNRFAPPAHVGAHLLVCSACKIGAPLPSWLASVQLIYAERAVANLDDEQSAMKFTKHHCKQLEKKTFRDGSRLAGSGSGSGLTRFSLLVRISLLIQSLDRNNHENIFLRYQPNF